MPNSLDLGYFDQNTLKTQLTRALGPKWTSESESTVKIGSRKVLGSVFPDSAIFHICHISHIFRLKVS